MSSHKVFSMTFASLYKLYVQKAENKGRNEKEVLQVMSWLTGYTEKKIIKLTNGTTEFGTFFNEAPKINPNISLITGVVCGIRVEEIEDPLMHKCRCLDKLIDELAKGKAMEKILRS